MPECAIITGAASGLGRALAFALAGECPVQVLGDLDEAGLRETATRLAARGVHVHALKIDAAAEEGWAALAAAFADTEAELGWVIPSAGVAAAGATEDLPPELWSWTLGVNLMGAVHAARTFLPVLRSQGRGRLLLISSRAAFTCPPAMGPYNASKAALVAFAETLHGELRGSGVGVTVGCPGFFRSGFAAKVQGTDPRARALATAFAEASRREAEEVAAALLRDARRHRLYAVPSGQDRLLWRLKRWMPLKTLAQVARTYASALARL